MCPPEKEKTMMAMDRRPNVLFVCNKNGARSQMVEALLRKYAGDRFNVFSAGLHPEPEIHPLALKVMEEIGVSLEGQRAKSTKEYMAKITPNYLIITMKRDEEHCPRMFPGMQCRLEWPFDDPRQVDGTAEERLDAFRRVRDQIDERVRDWLEDMKEHDDSADTYVPMR
jgi:arsenate reductase